MEELQIKSCDITNNLLPTIYEKQYNNIKEQLKTCATQYRQDRSNKCDTIELADVISYIENNKNNINTEILKNDYYYNYEIQTDNKQNMKRSLLNFFTETIKKSLQANNGEINVGCSYHHNDHYYALNIRYIDNVLYFNWANSIDNDSTYPTIEDLQDTVSIIIGLLQDIGINPDNVYSTKLIGQDMKIQGELAENQDCSFCSILNAYRMGLPSNQEFKKNITPKIEGRYYSKINIYQYNHKKDMNFQKNIETLYDKYPLVSRGILHGKTYNTNYHNNKYTDIANFLIPDLNKIHNDIFLQDEKWQNFKEQAKDIDKNNNNTFLCNIINEIEKLLKDYILYNIANKNDLKYKFYTDIYELWDRQKNSFKSDLETLSKNYKTDIDKYILDECQTLLKELNIFTLPKPNDIHDKTIIPNILKNSQHNFHNKSLISITQDITGIINNSSSKCNDEKISHFLSQFNNYINNNNKLFNSITNVISSNNKEEIKNENISSINNNQKQIESKNYNSITNEEKQKDKAENKNKKQLYLKQLISNHCSNKKHIKQPTVKSNKQFTTNLQNKKIIQQYKKRTENINKMKLHFKQLISNHYSNKKYIKQPTVESYKKFTRYFQHRRNLQQYKKRIDNINKMKLDFKQLISNHYSDKKHIKQPAVGSYKKFTRYFQHRRNLQQYNKPTDKKKKYFLDNILKNRENKNKDKDVSSKYL